MKTLNTMTVGELKAYLEEFPDKCKVAFSYPAGDHWRTELVGTITQAEYANVEYTEYHRVFQVLTTEDGPKKSQEILILG